MEMQMQEPGGGIEIPKIAAPKTEEKGKGMKQLFITLLILTIGLFIILMVGDWLFGTLPLPTGTMDLQGMLRSTGMTIVYALAGITGLVFIGWLFARRTK